MTRILLINPNTSTKMTDDVEQTASAIAASNTEITALCPSNGPESLESFYEYHLAAVASLDAVQAFEGELDGVVVACYGDPGLYPLKEVLDVPVVGVAEASMATATLLGHRFSVLVALERAVPMMETLVQQYGLSDRLASVEPIGLSVLDLDDDETQTIEALTEAGKRAKQQANAEVFLLGCAGMSGYETRLSKQLGSPVVDPVQTAVTTVERLVKQGLSQSTDGLWAAPPTKSMQGELPGDEFGSDT